MEYDFKHCSIDTIVAHAPYDRLEVSTMDSTRVSTQEAPDVPANVF